MSRSAATRCARSVCALTIVATVALVEVSAASAAPKPNLSAAVHYLTTTTGANGVVGGTSLAHDGYYDAFDQFGDFGLTIDAAFALAATRTDNATLKKVVAFIDAKKTDASGRSIDDWTGIGTAFASGGAIGKEALLAEITGFDPRNFGGHDLVTAVDHTLCTTTDAANGCAGPGNFLYSASTFSQSLGVIAQLRANDAAHAAPAIAYLESLQNSAGAWPSVLPSGGDSDVDSTAMAIMALALLPKDDATAAAAVNKAVAWIASRQRPTGAFPGVAADSTNSSGLAIQALTLAGGTYATQITKATAFLAGQQNADGGFNADAIPGQGSDVRASAQAVGGVVGTAFGTLSDVLPKGDGGGGVSTGGTTVPPTSPSSTSVTTSTSVPASSTTIAATDPSVTAAQLPATGAGTDRSLAWAVALVALGVGATWAGRRRSGRA